MRASTMVLTVLCALIALSACRREVAYEPLKLGGPPVEKPTR